MNAHTASVWALNKTKSISYLKLYIKLVFRFDCDTQKEKDQLKQQLNAGNWIYQVL